MVLHAQSGDPTSTILLIDDDTQVRGLIRFALESGGHAVRESRGGKEGVDSYRAERPDLVITDMYMAEGDGVEAMLAIRKMDPGARIMAVSGGSQRVEGVNMLPIAEKIGALRVLHKPFTVTLLLAGWKGYWPSHRSRVATLNAVGPGTDARLASHQNEG